MLLKIPTMEFLLMIVRLWSRLLREELQPLYAKHVEVSLVIQNTDNTLMRFKLALD